MAYYIHYERTVIYGKKPLMEGAFNLPPLVFNIYWIVDIYTTSKLYIFKLKYLPWKTY